MDSPRALQLWHQYGPILNKLGLCESLDAIGFSMLCEAIDFYLAASDKLSSENLVEYVGESQSPVQNPLVAIVRQQSKAIRELLVEFGMTPTGRVRLTGSTSVQPVDSGELNPFEALTKKMQAGAISPPPIPESPVTPARRKKAAAKKKATKTRKR
jgi:P27 family predicted phage terminase small subunit